MAVRAEPEAVARAMVTGFNGDGEDGCGGNRGGDRGQDEVVVAAA